MIKFDFNIWNNKNTVEDSNDELPLFIDINNLFIKNKNYIELIDVVLITKHIKLDTLIFEKYGGYSLVEQFNLIKVILPLILMFNEFNDITKIQVGYFLKLPDINMLIDNLWVYEENELMVEETTNYIDNKLNLLPGLNVINKYNLQLSNKIDETKNTGIPAMNIQIDKVSYDSSKGIITY